MSRSALAYKPPRQRRSHESLERILDAAESLIRERGFDTMTIAEVVQRSGSSVGSLYARFNNKLGLLQRRAVALSRSGPERHFRCIQR